MNYTSLFKQSVEKWSERVALVDRDGQRGTTYGELDKLSALVVGKLLAQGFGKGDFVLVNMGRRMEYIAAYIGVLKAGCVVVPVVPDYPEDRINFIRTDCGSQLTIDEAFFADIEQYSPQEVTVADTDPAMLAYTSGSTGMPKGILFCAADLARSAVRHASLFQGVEPVVYGGAALFSFLLHAIEYLTVLSIGGTTHILEDEVRKSAVALASYYQQHAVTVGIITPQMLRLYRNSDPSLQRVITCGERLSRIAPQDYELLNGYGMSELVAFVTTFKVEQAYENTPIGTAMESVEVQLLDDDNNPVAQGEEGEICAIGMFNAQYFKDPDKSARVFQRLPDGRTLVHTGDMGYMNEEGNIVFSNRKDWMVKVNGQRVETLEIESRLMDMPQIGNAAVKAFEDADGQNYLVAFYVEKQPADEALLRTALAKTLPGYMIPRFFVKMDDLPRNVNGKLDRKSLAPPTLDRYKVAYCAPADALETRLCEAFERLLRCGTVGAEDDFFALGGDSIKVLRLLQELDAYSLTPDMIFKARTPRAIAALCKSATLQRVLHRADTPDFCPLSDSQLGVYLDSTADAQSVKYNIPVMCRLPEHTDVVRFKEAVKRVAENHKCLRVTIVEQGGTPGMRYSDNEITISERVTDDLAAESSRLIEPFDLARGPLYRFVILRSPQGCAFFFDIHHIVFDGTSVTAFLDQIARAYEGEEIPVEGLSLFDVALSETGLQESEAYHDAQEFFKNRLDGVECDSAPVPDVIAPDEDDEVRAEHVELAAEGIDAEAVSHFARTHGITENTLFVSAFAYTLAKINAARYSCFCTVDNGRHDHRLADAVGMFVRTFPLYTEIDEQRTVAQFLRESQEVLMGSMAHDCISFGELASLYGVGMSVTFVYQAEMFVGPHMAGGTLDVAKLSTRDIQSDLHFMLFRSGAGYCLNVGFRTKLYSQGFVARFAAMYLQVVRGMLSAHILADVPLADDAAQRAIHDFNLTEVPYETETTVVDLFRHQAATTPDNPCLVYQEKRFSYREVDDITNRLAAHLVASGLTRGSVVGILIPRCEYMLLASMGVLKAGCAYLPLDPSYPEERLNLMVGDSGAQMLITTPELSSIITPDFQGIRMMTDEIMRLQPSNPANLPSIHPDDLFIILYTSGSTGKPKGVMFRHSNTLVTASWERRFYALAPGANVTAYASYGFDANVFDTYATIISGATLHIISDEIRLDLPLLRRYFNDNAITHATMTTQVGRQFAEMGGLQTLRYLNVAGEKLTPLAPPQGFKLFNLYGPTEGSILASGFLVDRLYKDIPIGKAIDNVKLYVVDAQGRLLPPGAAGELYISGAHVTAGYLNRPEKTAEAYGCNPFCDDPGYERIYRTGDIVRFMEDGNLQFIGRRDAQVKVRGFRVELTEVEEVVRRFPGIKDATVAAFDDPSGGKFIAAYIVADSEVDIDALNNFIRAEKPPYMVPAVTMQIPAIPLNQNQKVNKKALPRPQRKAEHIVPPENDTQRKICSLVAQVLGHDSFGIETNLFESGLTSIGVLKLNVLLGTEFDVSMKIDDIKANDTVRKLEALLQGSLATTHYELQEDYPLTQTQMGIFVECSTAPDSVAYNIPVMFKLGSGVETDKLVLAVKSALNAHPYVKTTLFSDAEGNIRARCNDLLEPRVDVEQFDHIPSDEDLVHPFPLMEAPLYRALVILSPEGNCLFLDFHHIIADGTSEAILVSDIDKAYAGTALNAETFGGFEAALEEARERTSPRYLKAKEYYTHIFAGCDAECLPPKSPEAAPGHQVPVAGRVNRRFDIPASQVRQFCDAAQLTMNAFFNAVFGFTLGRFAGREELVFTTIYNGRSNSRLASAFTMLVKTLPVLMRIDNATRVSEFVRNLQEQLMDSMSNDIYSFAEIARECGVKSDVIFVYQGDNFNFDHLCGEPATCRTLLPPVAKAPLTLTVNVVKDSLELEAEYRTDHFSAVYLQGFLDAFEQAVAEFMDKELLKHISLLSPNAERRLAQINDTARDFESVSVNRLFERHVAATPQKLAVVCQDRSLTYDQLNRASNRLARKLKEYGVKKDSVVGMVLDRSCLLTVSEMAILKAGGAFLGILPDYPDDRILYCLTDAESPVVLTTADIKSARPTLFDDEKPYRTLLIDDIDNPNQQASQCETSTPNCQDDTNLDLAIPTDSLAYCIYTSGSTGKPKGVMVEHRNLACMAQPADFTYSYYYGDKGGNVSLAISSISFDMSVMDNLLNLLTGRSVRVATNKEIHNPLALAACMMESHVDLVVATPSILTNYIGVAEFRQALAGVKTLVSGAESFPASLYDELRKISPTMHIINGYGPSECTITCCCKMISSNSGITIGGPTANTAFYVMDKAGNLLPPFACGELVICGGLVGRGYIHLPEKTAASFFQLNGMPAYHSGDTVRLNKDGEVEFFGRMDNQVKLRGFRVELDEIERCYLAFEGVKQCKVVVRNNGNEDYLAGFFTADREIDLADLTAFLKTRLTYYMVPDVMMQIESIPLTPSGKVNVKALPEIKRESKKRSNRKSPKKSLEQQLCDLFMGVLSLDEYFADDNFFEMGGTSLSASKVIMQLMSKGIKVEYQDIFDHPTPEDLAQYVESLRQSQPAAAAPAETARVDNSDIAETLKFNTLEYAHEVTRKPVGDVLLTGAVGFLGIHILKELLDRNEGSITCLVRKGDMPSAEKRLQNMLMYYFDNPFVEAFSTRIRVIDADITDDNICQRLAELHFDTLINCAAVVKHYASDDIIERVNVHGVENLIAATRAAGARMVQVSTVSVPGVHTQESYFRQVKMHENELFVIDDMDNKYCISKYHAELKMLEAVRHGLRGKIIRVGNLMGRHSDGEFQINFNTNAFMNALRGFTTIGKCPISHATDPMSFSPIDMTAKAIVLLAGTDDKFTAFHADSRFGFDEMQLIEACNHCGLSIKPVSDDEYYTDYYNLLGDAKINAKLQGLVTNDRPDLHMVETDNLFSANVLYRLGFSWPLVDSAYLERAIESLLTLDYFEADEQ